MYNTTPSALKNERLGAHKRMRDWGRGWCSERVCMHPSSRERVSQVVTKECHKSSTHLLVSGSPLHAGFSCLALGEVCWEVVGVLVLHL